MSAFPGISQEDWDSLLEGLIRGQYHLLGGAGINSDCKGGDGNPIPTSPSLIEQLVSDFNIETGGEEIDLKRAYEYIETLRDRKGRTRYQYFKERFSNCTTAWQDLIFRFDWKRIWTLNIDDVLENAFEKYLADNDNRRECYSYSWNEPFTELSRENNDFQIVHLHGYARNSDNLIFSILEHLAAVSGRNAWHPVFGDDYLQDPFIIIGAKLSDEIDLHEFIARGNQAKTLLGRPSLIILKEITKLRRTECIKWGLIPIESDAKTFLEYILPHLAELERKMGETLKIKTAELPKEAKIFLRQFRELIPDKDRQIIPYGHDFYAGYEPIWPDILNNYDVRFESIDNINREIVSVLEGDNDQSFYYISGDAGSGKTAIILRVARDLISQGKSVFIFRSEERFSVNSVVWWLKHSPNTVLIFDNVADFMAEIVGLCEMCKKEKVKLLIVAAERTRRENVIIQELEYTFLQKYKKSRLGYLSNKDIDNLIEKLKTQGRLGKITRSFIEDQRYYFRKRANRELFPAMADLEGGLGFVRRIVKEYKDEIKSDILKQLYALICVSHTFGYALPISICSSATGMNVSEIVKEVSDGQLYKIVFFDSKGLKARHRVFASNIVERACNDKERFELVKNLSISLAPHISITAIKQKTLYYRIIRELMNARIMIDWLGYPLAQKYYDDLLPYYDWDARYWEQRALAEARMEHLDKAMSYAETALSRNRDFLTLNTLGTILLRISTSKEFSDAEGAIDSYWKGIGYLRESAELAKDIFPHPFTSYFTHTLRYVEVRFKNQEVDRLLIKEWEWWQNRANRCIYFKSADNLTELEKYHVNWMKLITGRTNE